jgi:hypothetical protein
MPEPEQPAADPGQYAAAVLGRRGDIGGRGRAEDDRRDHAAQSHVHVRQFQIHGPAIGALIEMRGHCRRFPFGEPAADVPAEFGGRRPALAPCRPGQVHLQVGLAQALPCPVGQSRDTIRRQPEQRGHIGGPRALDLGVPEHRAPAFG